MTLDSCTGNHLHDTWSVIASNSLPSLGVEFTLKGRWGVNHTDLWSDVDATQEPRRRRAAQSQDAAQLTNFLLGLPCYLHFLHYDWKKITS